ncbi:hypothetical protein RJ640_010666 [Escallonia rubra]|uniref:Uncharacterized protein n=1 Tax=Escallonia rubra TaxID=112253 RepID=A0AA88R6N2_9ASTE|nr:hypothetical protein RJ640_010666 [Escallonia rubra]
MAEQLLSATADLTSATLRRPFDRGYLVNPDLQSSLWSHLFSSLLRVTPSTSSLLLTEPLFNLPSIQRSTDEIVFEEFGFRSLFVADSPSLVHLYEASRQPSHLVTGLVLPICTFNICCCNLVPLDGGDRKMANDLGLSQIEADGDVKHCSCSALGAKKRIWEASHTSLKSKKVKGGHQIDC